MQPPPPVECDPPALQMIVREVRILRVSSDADHAVAEINAYLRSHPNFGLLSYEISPFHRAVFGRYGQAGDVSEMRFKPGDQVCVTGAHPWRGRHGEVVEQSTLDGLDWIVELGAVGRVAVAESDLRAAA